MNKKLGMARAIWSNRFAVAIMILCVGLSGLCFGKAITLTHRFEFSWWALWVILWLLVVIQVCLALLLVWARKVVNSGQEKL